MNDPLLQLREDMKADAVKALKATGVVREATARAVEREDGSHGPTAIATNAMLKTIDAFRDKCEAVEVDHYLNKNVHPPRRCWDDAPQSFRKPITIIVPRKQEPTLAEAAEALDAAIGGLANVRIRQETASAWRVINTARATVAAALKREADNG